MHAVSLNPFASQSAINAMIVWCFNVVRVYKLLLSSLGERLYSKSRSSFSALSKFVGLFYHFLQLVSRNSGKGSLTSGSAWSPRMPEQRYGKRAVNELRAMETYKKTKKLLPCACFCQTTMLIPKIIKEAIENLFQFDLDNDKS